MNVVDREDLHEIFEQIAMTVAGVLITHDADDNLTWAVARSLDPVFQEHLHPESFEAVPPTTSRARRHDVFNIERRSREPHPAMVELLISIGRYSPKRQSA